MLALREMLLRGDFGAGIRLTELALAARLGASRPRYGTRRPYLLGPRGPPPAVPVARGAVVHAGADIGMRSRSVGALEGIAARLAAQRYRDPGELSRLRVNCAEMEGLGCRQRSGLRPVPRGQPGVPCRGVAPGAQPDAVAQHRGDHGAPVRGAGARRREAEQAVEQRIRPIALEHHRSIVEAIEERDGATARASPESNSRCPQQPDAGAPRPGATKSVPGGALIRVR